MSRHLRLLLAATALVVAPLAAPCAAPLGPSGATDFSAQGSLANPGGGAPAAQPAPAPAQSGGSLGGGGRPAAAPAQRPAGRPAGPAPGSLAAPGRPFAPSVVRPGAPSFGGRPSHPHHGGRPSHPPQHYGGRPFGAPPRYVAPAPGPRYGGPPPRHYGGRHVSFIRGPHYVHRRGMARRLAAVTALSALAIGSRYYYPYAYVPLAERTCYGVTPEGCELDWAEVRTVDGYIVDQCVAYCPR